MQLGVSAAVAILGDRRLPKSGKLNKLLGSWGFLDGLGASCLRANNKLPAIFVHNQEPVLVKNGISIVGITPWKLSLVKLFLLPVLGGWDVRDRAPTGVGCGVHYYFFDSHPFK
jgi:hypothetical protein